MVFLFNNRDDLGDYPLVKMHDRVIKSRDGLNLVSYLSLPPGSDPDNDGIPNQPLPMVLDVHGGPWARDGWGLNGYHQWLANRGYAVLSVNYRGSTGFGKEFINAANGEWSGKMHDDLLDAVKWAVDNKIAEKDKVAIMGGSYGGYATLVGLTYTPDVFACGVDIVGPSSLVTLLQNVPDYWHALHARDESPRRRRQTRKKAAPRCSSARRLRYVDKIKKPLLIGQGENDPRVKQLEADQIVKAMTDKNIPGHVRALSRRRPRLPPAGKQQVVQRRNRSIPGRATRRPLRTRRRRLQRREHHRAGRRRTRARPGQSALAERFRKQPKTKSSFRKAKKDAEK